MHVDFTHGLIGAANDDVLGIHRDQRARYRVLAIVVGGDGDDEITVDLTGAPVGLDVVVDGGSGTDSVAMAGDSATSSYTSSSSGAALDGDRSGSRVRTTGVETLVDSASGSLASSSRCSRTG